MAADLIVAGRIATLGGTHGLAWAEAVAISDGWVTAAGSLPDVGAAASSGTRWLRLAPDEVAIPGLTDAHLHLVDAALALERVDLSAAATLEDGLALVREAHQRTRDADAWLVGHGWDANRWGGWPTASALDRVAPGRRAAFWQHDHHALWVSSAGLRAAGITGVTPDPAGGLIRRGPNGDPEGCLQESASALVADRIPPPGEDDIERLVPILGRQLQALGVVAVHDPGTLAADPGLTGAYRAYAALVDRGAMPLRVHASLRSDGVPEARRRGLRSAMPLGSAPGSRVRVGWQKLFADGTLGSRTAAMLAPFESEEGRQLPNDGLGIWVTSPDELARLVEVAAEAGIASQIHAIGDAGVRAAIDALAPSTGATPLQPRVEHAQLVDPADLPRFARHGIAASIQPVHIRSDMHQARAGWGGRAETTAYAFAALRDAGAVLAAGTDAPVEPIDPWPGIALAVTRTAAEWGAGTPPLGAGQALTLAEAVRAACLGPAESAGEADRGRLTPGHRADVVVVPASALDEPVEPTGPLSTARPTRVLMDGLVVFEG